MILFHEPILKYVGDPKYSVVMGSKRGDATQNHFLVGWGILW